MRTWTSLLLLAVAAGCSSTPPATVTCNADETLCGGSCAKLKLDDKNCGSCGVACGADEACANGACYPSDCVGTPCDPSSVCFQDVCTDKACVGVVCPTGLTCSQGTCVCAAGRLTCGGGCVDPQTDDAHCGGCGHACAATEACVQGACLPKDCPQEDCDPLSVCYQGACVDRPCVGVVCSGGQVCQGGVCACPPKSTTCGGSCVDPKTDSAHCGSCDTGCGAGTRCAAGACLPTACDGGACDPLSVCYQGGCVEAACVGVACTGGQRCTAGVCVCPQGQVLCNGACVDVQGDAQHCGRCGNACPSGQACAAGACVMNACPSGQVPCAGGCVDTRIDPNHCGACGAACGAGRNCVGGQCQCPGGLTLCGTACVNLATDGTNCGACGRTCGAGSCSGGFCQCPSGQSPCNGTCVTLATDAMNCGQCGRTCSNGQVCSNGSCACPPGQSLCGGQCISTSADNLNCGGCGTVCPSGRYCSGGSCVLPFTCQTNYNAPPADCADFPVNLANCGQPTLAGTEGPYTGVVAASGQKFILPVPLAPNQMARTTTTLFGSGSGTNYRVGYLNDAGVELNGVTGTANSSSPAIRTMDYRGSPYSCAHPTGFYVADTFGSNLSYSIALERYALNGRMNVGGTSPMSPTALRTNAAGRTCDQVCGAVTRQCGDGQQSFSLVIPAGKAAIFNYAVTGAQNGSIFYLYAQEANGNSICELVRNQIADNSGWQFFQARLVNNTAQAQTVVVLPTNSFGGSVTDTFQLSVAVEP